MPTVADLVEETAVRDGVPTLFGELRRGRLLGWDDASSTWEGWDTRSGERVLLGVPRAGREPAFAGRVARAGFEAGPCCRSVVIECTLADLLPDAPDLSWTAEVLGGVIADLARLHALGLAHGAVGPERVVRASGRWHLAWVGEEGTVEADLLALCGLAESLDPEGAVWPLGAAPPSARDAARIFVAALGSLLAAERHRVVRRERSLVRHHRAAALRRLVSRLGLAAGAPVASGRLCRDRDGVETWITSDGAQVRGGHTTGGATERLPLLAHDGHLDAALVRASLRAWARRGPEEAADVPVARLMRWLAAALQLRTDRRLLERTA